MPTKRTTATPKEAKADTSGDGQLSNLERLEAIEARLVNLEQGMALDQAARRAMFHNA